MAGLWQWETGQMFIVHFRYQGWKKGAMKALSLISALGKAEIWVTSSMPTTTSDHISEPYFPIRSTAEINALKIMWPLHFRG